MAIVRQTLTYCYEVIFIIFHFSFQVLKFYFCRAKEKCLFMYTVQYIYLGSQSIKSENK